MGSNRITSAGFEYDAAGNQTRAQAEDGSWLRYEYDTANRLSLVRQDSDGAALQAYQYSPTSGRLMNYDYLSGEFILYANKGGTTLSEYHEYTQNIPTWTKSYVYLGDSILSTVTPNGAGGENTDFNHPDRLGTRVITNQAAGTSSEQATLPFGTALNAESTITTNKNRFTSYDRSTRTGLDYAVNRNYDSKQGRFTSVDPIGMSASSLYSPQTLNLYTYCGNDPINHTDPSGLFWGSLFRWIGNAIANLVKRIIIAAVKAAITAVFTYITSGGNLGAAVAAFIGAFIGAFVVNLGFPKLGNVFTPSWNPNVRHPLSGASGLSSKYVIRNIFSTYQGVAQLGVLSVAGAIANFFANFNKLSLQGNCGVNPVTGKPGIKTKPYNGFGTLRSDSKGSGEWRASRGGRPGAHKGIDISGFLLQSVGAFRSGKITRAGSVKGYGNTIEVTHSDESISKYHHLDSLFVKLGDKVGEGATIGFLGQTGNAGGTIPHVDFEIFKDGEYKNPVDILNSPCP